MKKAACIILLFLVCLNFTAAAYADGGQNGSGDGSSGNQPSAVPAFTVTYSNLPDGVSIPPNEGSFLCEPVSGTNNPENMMLSFGTPTVSGSVMTVPFVFPDGYSVIGEYRYSIRQNAGKIMGVTYDDVPFVFCVLVGYSDDGSIGVVASGAGSDGNGEGKKIGFENIYRTGTLNVTNTVEGNIGDRDKDFAITVTFSIPEESSIESPITYSVPGVDSPQTIAVDAWQTSGSNKTTSVTIHLKSSQSATFSNVPAGVSYTLMPTQAEGYTQTVSPGPGTIAADSSASAGVTNTMNGTLNAGIVYRTTAYVIVFAFAVIGLLALLLGKRRSRP
ncbi:MAG: hypothetical protein IJH70_09490 [Oscillospiraceae bacterium]|nr:hypothetical protein [Oscillospiraceae bacterium]